MIYNFKFHKLIRDNIPNLMEKDKNAKLYTRKLSHEECIKALKNKLLEEASEVIESQNKSELISELGDVLDIIDKIIELENINIKDMISQRQEKNIRNGSFNDGIFAEYLECNEQFKDLQYYKKDPQKYKCTLINKL